MLKRVMSACNSEMLSVLLELMRDFSEENKLKLFMQSFVLMRLIRRDSPEMVSVFLESIRPFSEEIKMQLLMQRDGEGDSGFSRAFEMENPQISRLVLEWTGRFSRVTEILTQKIYEHTTLLDLALELSPDALARMFSQSNLQDESCAEAWICALAPLDTVRFTKAIRCLSPGGGRPEFFMPANSEFFKRLERAHRDAVSGESRCCILL